MKLKIGGRLRQEGFQTLDIDPTTNPDIVGDMTSMPLESGTVTHIIMDNVIEHDDMFRIVKEIHRVGKDGCIIEIWTPHYSSYHCWNDIQHKRGSSYFLFDKTYEYGLPFEVEHRHIMFEGRSYPHQKKGWTRWHYPLMIPEWFANRFPLLFERLWAGWFPAEALYFRLKVIKK